MGHVYTVASGFGLRVVPKRAPYVLAVGTSPGELDVELQADESQPFARVVADRGGYRSLVSKGTRSLYDVVDIQPGPPTSCWWLETALYRVPLPPSWRAYASGIIEPSAFDLIGPNGEMIYIQTPASLPTSFAAPGQTITRQGSDGRSTWIELAYRHDREPWIQRHDVVRVAARTCVVTSQCKRAHYTSAAPVWTQVASEIAPPFG